MKTINRQKDIVDSKMALNFSPKIWCKIHVHQPSLQLKNYSVLYVNSRSMYVYTYTGTYKKIEGLFWYPQVKLIWHNWDKSMQLNWYSKTINHHWTEAVIYHIFEILDNSTGMNVLSARSKLQIPWKNKYSLYLLHRHSVF